jgi:hypothetical protein
MEELDQSQRLELDQLREEYQKRYGVAVEFIKNEVGSGLEYENSVARAVVSENGAWFECVDQPMEFSGGSGDAVTHRYIENREALEIVRALYERSREVSRENSRLFGLLVIYTRSGVVDNRGAYLFHFQAESKDSGRRPQRLGRFRPDALPRVFRCRLDTNLEDLPTKFKRGVVFCLTGIGEKNLLVEIPYEGKDVRNLGDAPLHPVRQ